MYKIYKMIAAVTFAASLFLGQAIVTSPGASARVVAKVSLASQRMTVYVNGRRRYSWRISSGKWGYSTPRGTYRPTIVKRMHYSRKYYNSPMPYSVFFRGGYAIHGTYATRRLGRRASHGCIRLHPAHAATFYSLVRRYGRGRTRIRIL